MVKKIQMYMSQQRSPNIKYNLIMDLSEMILFKEVSRLKVLVLG